MKVFTAYTDALDKKNVRQIHVEHFLKSHTLAKLCDEKSYIKVIHYKKNSVMYL